MKSNSVLWHVYPLGFCGCPVDNDAPDTVVHRLRRLTEWMGNVRDTGFDGVLLGPVFAASSHGYDTLDHMAIDPRLGDLSDMVDFLHTCNDLGLQVILDGVFSHVGSQHPLFQEALSGGPSAEAARLFTIDWNAQPHPQPEVFEGHGSLVRLNHDNQETVNYVASVMKYWIGQGASGWRLDAAYSVAPSFWRAVLAIVRAEYPDAWFVGEVIHGDYDAFVKESTVDSVTQYQLWKAIWSSLKDPNFFELDWAIQQNNRFLDTFLPQTFIGNHDVTRIGTVLPPDLALIACAVLMSVGGIPSIYYGDEIGLQGIKEQRFGGDDAIRPAYPRVDAAGYFGNQVMKREYHRLIQLRRERPWLQAARTISSTLANDSYAFRTESRLGADAIEVSISLGKTVTASIRDAAGSLLWSLPQDSLR